jgi:alpha-L-fucosidase
MIAEFYNANASWHHGTNEAVMCIKDWGNQPWGYYWDGIATLSRERTHLTEIRKEPWQTETSIGDWTWNRNEKYRTPNEIIHELIDVVSKNGNLMLNVSPKADGTLDDDATKLLTDIGDWMKINGEAIYDTRPWIIFGEGPTNFKDPNDAQTHDIPFTSSDIRYTRRGNDIYAMTMDLPSQRVVLRALSSDSPLVTGKITKVTLMGESDDLHWYRTAESLVIDLPKTPPCKISLSFKISGLTTVSDIDPARMKSFQDRLTKPPVEG